MTTAKTWWLKLIQQSLEQEAKNAREYLFEGIIPCLIDGFMD